MGGYAWVTLATNDSYSLGALVLAHSLKQAGTAHRLAVLVTPGVTNSMRQKLAGVFDLVEEVNVLDSKDEANLRLLKRPELGITFTKLHCWRLTQFEKCVFLDADTLVLKNADELFERDEFSAAPDVGWPDCFNSGVFVYRPSNETYDKLVEFALSKGSFDGGDQGLLNLYFSDWAHKDINKHLPFIYNMCSTACYSYLPAFKQFGSDVKIVHFIGTTKPWLQYFNSETKQVQPGGDMQHLQLVLQKWWDLFCSLVHSNLSSDMNDQPTIAHYIIADSTFCQPSDNRDVWDPWEDYVVNNDAKSSSNSDNQFESHNTNSLHALNSDIIPSPTALTPTPAPAPAPSSPDLIVEELIVAQPVSPSPPNSPDHIESVAAENITNTFNTEVPPTVLTFPEYKNTNVPNNVPQVIESENSSEISVASSNDSPNIDIVNSANVIEDCTTNEENDGGLAGAFAQFSLGAPRSQDQNDLEDHLRRQSWEVGNIDYMGRDAFDKIWSKITETIATGPDSGSKEAATPAPTAEAETSAQPTEDAAAKSVQEESKAGTPVDAKAEEKPTTEAQLPEVPKVEEVKPETPKADEVKPEATKIEEVKPEASKVEEPKPETPKVEETKSEAPKAEEVKPEAPKADEVKTEAPKAEEVKSEEPKPDSPKVEEAKPEAPKTEEVKAEEPKPDSPKVEEAKPEAPKTEEVKPEVPKVEEVKPEVCSVAETKPEAPKTEEVKPEASKAEESKPEVAKTEEVKPETPKVEELKAEPPKVEKVKPEVTKVEEVKPDTPTTETSKPEVVTLEASQTEPVKTEEIKPETPKAEQVKQEAHKTEEVKVEAPKTGEVKPEVATTEEVKSEPPKIEEVKAEAPKAEEPKIEGEKPVEAESKADSKEQPKVEETKTLEEPKVEAKQEAAPVVPEKPVESTPCEKLPEAQVCPEACKKAECSKESCPKKETCPTQESCAKSECPVKAAECAKQETSPAATECPKASEGCPKKEDSPKQEDTCAEPECVGGECALPSKCAKTAKADATVIECSKSEVPSEATLVEETKTTEIPSTQQAELKLDVEVAKKEEAADVPKAETKDSSTGKAEKKESPKVDASVTAPPAESDVPATPEVTAPTPPTTPCSAEVQEGAVGLDVKAVAPETPPPAQAESAPVPPPRKTSGAKKPKGKK